MYQVTVISGITDKYTHSCSPKLNTLEQAEIFGNARVNGNRTAEGIYTIEPLTNVSEFAMRMEYLRVKKCMLTD